MSYHVFSSGPETANRSGYVLPKTSYYEVRYDFARTHVSDLPTRYYPWHAVLPASQKHDVHFPCAVALLAAQDRLR